MVISKKPTASNNVFKNIVREVVKDELQTFEKRMDSKMDRKFDNFKEEITTEFNDKLNEKIRLLPTRDEFLTTMDQVMGELQLIREEQIGHFGQHDDLHSLPQKVADLESIHPHNQHA